MSIADQLEANYEGPTRFVAPERRHGRARFSIRAIAEVPRGARLRLLLGRFRSLLDNNPQRFQQWVGFAAEADAGEVTVVHGPPRTFHEMHKTRQNDPELFNHYVVGLAEVAEPVPAGGTLTLAIDGLLSHQAPLAARLLVQAQASEGEAFAAIGAPVALANVPGETVGIEARAGATPDGRGAHPLHVHGLDAAANPSEPEIAIGGLETEVLGPGRIEQGRLCPDGETPVRVRLRDPRRGFEAVTNPVGAGLFGGRRVCFGEFHFHTRFSGDGDRELEQAYRYARDTLGLDFAGVTDHTPTGFWRETARINEAFHEPGRFVTIPSWEWSTPTGHSNVYLRHPDVAAGPEHAATADHPGNAHWPDDAVVVPHHTNIRATERKPDGTPFWHEFDWTLPNRRVRLVELIQSRGNFEQDRYDADWGVVTAGIGASVQDALAMGYRIGFVGGTDNHTGFPTRHAELESDFVGMACVLADELSRDALFHAMDARRTYATSGKPILCHWTVNGHEMGEEGRLAEDEGVRFSASLHGTAPIGRVEVVSEGAVVWRGHPDAWDCVLADEPLPAPAGAGAYYYLRLRQHDGHRAWLSPVWLDRHCKNPARSVGE